MRVVVVVAAVLVAGCHGGNAMPGDAGRDAAVLRDAPPDLADASDRGPITVTVYGDGVDRNPGVPVPAATVYFVEPDGTTTEITTGIDGIATATEPNNTTAWIVHRDGSSSYFIETYEGLQVGDSLIAGDPTPLAPNTIVGTAYVSHPAYSDATIYNLALSCTTGTPSSASTISEGFVACPQEMAANAVIWATDSTGNLGYTSASGIDLTAHTSSMTAVALGAFQPGATIGVTFTNLPSTLGESDAQMQAVYTSGSDPTVLQRIELQEGTLTDTMTASGPIAPVGDHTRIYGQVSIARNAYAYTYQSTSPARLASVTIDASTMVHPSSTWHYDASTSLVWWNQQPIGVDPTVVRSSLNWNLGSSVDWSLTAPYAGSPTLTLPAFPAQLASLAASPADAAFKQVDLTSYAGSTYHDVLVGNAAAAGAASWHIGVGP